MALTPKKQQTIMQAIEAARLRIEVNEKRIVELVSSNETLKSSVKLLEFELRKVDGSGGLGDSMNFMEENVGFSLGCGHVNIVNGRCTQCKEKIDVES